MATFNDEKSQKSIKEIILVFSDIDVKITALTECSAEDFLSLNNYLKKFYQDAKVISGQTEQSDKARGMGIYSAVSVQA